MSKANTKKYLELLHHIKTEARARGSKITQEEIAKGLGYHRTYLSQLINGGNITGDHIKKLELYFEEYLKPPDYKDLYIKSLEERIRILEKLVAKK